METNNSKPPVTKEGAKASQPLWLKDLALHPTEFSVLFEKTNHNGKIIADKIYKCQSEITRDVFHSKQTKVKVYEGYAVELLISLLRKGIVVEFTNPDCLKQVRQLTPPLYDKYYANQQATPPPTKGEGSEWIDIKANPEKLHKIDIDNTIVVFDNGDRCFYNDVNWPFAEAIYAFVLPTPPNQ